MNIRIQVCNSLFWIVFWDWISRKKN